MIVTVGSIRGSPGVTSWSLLLAAAWPTAFDAERVVLEADPSGGVLGARYGWGVDPGTVSLIAALRRSGPGDRIAVESHARPVAPDLWVVPGPESAEQARAVLSVSASDLAVGLSRDDRAWFVDAGRLDESNPTLATVSAATVSIVVCGGRPEDVVALRSRVGLLRRNGAGTVGVIVTSSCPYRRSELVEFAEADQVWSASADVDLREAAAAVLGPSRRARRSMVWRRALDVAADVATLAGLPAAGVFEPRVGA